MVEGPENLKPKVRRPRPMHLWGVSDVLKFFRRHCSEYLSPFYATRYIDLFAEHEITGRVLLRIDDDSLYRMGIENNEHRDAILREILKQKLKTDIMEIRELQLKNNIYDNYPNYYK